MKSISVYFFLFALVLVAPFGVFAQDQAEDAPAHAAQSEEAKSLALQVREGLQDFTKDLNRSEKRHFGVIYGNYNLIKVVEKIREDVGDAVDQCGEQNPEIKEEADARYKTWTDAIDPVLQDAEANVGNMIVAQEYARPRKFDTFFKLVEKARDAHDKDVGKVPVTTLEACQTMIEKMDDTQENLTNLLTETLVSLPHALEEERQKEAEERAAQEQAAREKAEKEAEERKAAEEAEEDDAEDAEDAEDDADTPENDSE